MTFQSAIDVLWRYFSKSPPKPTWLELFSAVMFLLDLAGRHIIPNLGQDKPITISGVQKDLKKQGIDYGKPVKGKAIAKKLLALKQDAKGIKGVAMGVDQWAWLIPILLDLAKSFFGRK